MTRKTMLTQTKAKADLYLHTVKALQWCVNNDVDIPLDVFVQFERAVNRVELGGAGSGFFKHKGRDATNERGGSVARDSAEGIAARERIVANIPNDRGYQNREGWQRIWDGEVVDKATDQYASNISVYKITGNAGAMLDSGQSAKAMIGLSGKHKGEVLFTDSYKSHWELLNEAYGAVEQVNLDDWAHYYISNVDERTKYYDPSGTKSLNVSIDYLGIQFPGRGAVSPEDTESIEAMDNFFYSAEVMTKLGMPADTPLYLRNIPWGRSKSQGYRIGELQAQFEKMIELRGKYGRHGKVGGSSSTPTTGSSDKIDALHTLLQKNKKEIDEYAKDFVR